MRRYLVVPLGLCLMFTVQALGTGLSETNNGVYMAIGGDTSTNELMRFDDRIAYMPFCSTGQVVLAQASPVYGMRIKMVAPNGKEVDKTPLGLGFGSQFDQLHNYNDAHLTEICACGPYEGLLGKVLIPSLDQLFVIEKPGIYTLEIQMQMFRVGLPPSTNALSRNPILFSPVTIKVEKPADPKSKQSTTTTNR